MENRVIKFRAWDSFDNRMRDWDNLKRMAYSASGGVDYVFNSEHFHLMQSTGLHDKNGKEIFEGDLITRDGVYIREIKWYKNGFWSWQINSENKFPLTMLDNEIIGNIYESNLTNPK